MNLEQLEYQLTLLNNQPIVLIHHHFGNVSVASFGELQVVIDKSSGRVDFHLPTLSCAIKFSAEDVKSLEDLTPNLQAKKTIRLKGPNDYAETFNAIH